MQEQTIRVREERELAAIAETVIDQLAPTATDAAAVLALYGDLGAGKTTFTKYLAAALGVAETITSPTFVLLKRYQCEHPTITNMVHVDAYRMEDESEVEPLRLREVLEEVGTIVVIEWADRIPSLLPSRTISLRFAIDGEERIITGNGLSKKTTT